MHSAVHQRIAATWRLESGKVVAAVMRRVRDLGVAEDIAQDALVAALEHWPKDGIPDKPGAWLLTAARHRAIDHFRRRKRLDEKHQTIGRDLQERERALPDLDASLDETWATISCG